MAFASAAGRGAWAENAVDTLQAHFEHAHNTLLLVEHKLEDEFNKKYGNDANPMKLLSRIRKIQKELPLLEDECKKLLVAKQEFVDKTAKTLVENKNMLKSMQSRAGLPSRENDDLTVNSLQNVISELEAQAKDFL